MAAVLLKSECGGVMNLMGQMSLMMDLLQQNQNLVPRFVRYHCSVNHEYEAINEQYTYRLFLLSSTSLLALF